MLDSSLDGLRSIVYSSREIKVDLCILVPRSTADEVALDRATYS